MVLSSRRPIAPFRWKKRPHKSKCSYACLPIRWHGSPCGPAVREVVHQFSVEGLRVRGPIALASAREQHQRLAQPRCLPLTPGVKSRWRLSFRSVQRARRRCAEFRTCYFPLDDLNHCFPACRTLPLRKRKEAKEKGLSEPDSLWS